MTAVALSLGLFPIKVMGSLVIFVDGDAVLERVRQTSTPTIRPANEKIPLKYVDAAKNWDSLIKIALLDTEVVIFQSTCSWKESTLKVPFNAHLLLLLSQRQSDKKI